MVSIITVLLEKLLLVAIYQGKLQLMHATPACLEGNFVYQLYQYLSLPVNGVIECHILHILRNGTCHNLFEVARSMEGGCNSIEVQI